MPIPPLIALPYDTVNLVLGTARVRLNDSIDTLQPVSGKILENNQTFSQQAVNNAWRFFQEMLADRGFARLIDEVIIAGFPIVASLDPASQVWINWDGCFDGVSQYSSPALPADFTHPIKMWERVSSQSAAFSSAPMEKMLDGLPATTKTSYLGYWEWRNDTIYMPGSQLVEDLRIRYVKYLADFADVGSTPWFNQQVPIMRSSDSLSWFICAEIASARGDLTAAENFIARGEAAMKRIFNLDVKADQRVNTRRQPRSGRGSGSGSWY